MPSPRVVLVQQDHLPTEAEAYALMDDIEDALVMLENRDCDILVLVATSLQ